MHSDAIASMAAIHPQPIYLIHNLTPKLELKDFQASEVYTVDSLLLYTLLPSLSSSQMYLSMSSSGASQTTQVLKLLYI